MNSLDQLIEKATSEYNTEDDWAAIMEICDGIKNYPNGAKECAYLLRKQFHMKIPNVIMQTLTVIDACINNCGLVFKLEVATKDFTKDLKNLALKGHPKIADRTKDLIKKWAQEFKDDAPLFMLPLLYNELLRGGVTFPSPKMTKKAMRTNNPDFVETKEEEDDIAKAIHLSLKEANMTSTFGSPTRTSASNRQENKLAPTPAEPPNATLYPASSAPKVPKKAWALYDFEAVEDNEISFRANEVVMVVDDSDQNWWRGYTESNSSRQGLFPATFVSTDPKSNESPKKGVSFGAENAYPSSEDGESVNSSACTSSYIDESLIDRCLHMLNVADPTGKIPDPDELAHVEQKALSTSTLIDQELEKVDDCHSELAELNRKLNEALRFYDYLVTTTVMGGNKNLPPGPPLQNMPYPAINPSNPFIPGTYQSYGPHGQPQLSSTNKTNGEMPPYAYNDNMANPINSMNPSSFVSQPEGPTTSYPAYSQQYPPQGQVYPDPAHYQPQQQVPSAMYNAQGQHEMNYGQQPQPYVQQQHFAKMISSQAAQNMPSLNQFSQHNTYYPGQNAEPGADQYKFAPVYSGPEIAGNIDPQIYSQPQQQQQQIHNYNREDVYNVQYPPQPTLIPQMSRPNAP